MYAIWSLCLANLRKRKIQNGLITLLILLSTLLLSTSINVISNTENLFTNLHNKANGSHQILRLENELHDPEKVNQWWKEQEGVTASELMRFKYLSGITHQGKDIPNIYLFMMNTPELPFAVDNLIFAEGKKSAKPEEGTVWIPTSMAYLNKISVGDKIGFKTGKDVFELKVSAIVIDLPYGAPFTTNARIWMNHHDYQKQIHPIQGKDMYMMGLRFAEYSQSTEYWDRFEKYLGVSYLESKMEFEEISSFYLIINKMIAFVMIFLGLVMMAVALITIGFTISDTILAHYKIIGILKSLGLSNIRMIAVYVIQYAFLAVVSIIPGLICSVFLSKLIVKSSLSFLKTEHSQAIMTGAGILFIIGIFVLMLVILCTLIYANKARAIQPVQAIRYGMSETDNSKLTKRMSSHKISFEKWPVSFVIGLRNIFKNKKGSILMLILATVTSAVLVFGFVLLNSIISIQKTSPLWGYDDSDVAVTVFNKFAFSRTDFEKDLAAEKRIKNIGWYGGLNGVIVSEKQLDSEKSTTMNINIGAVDGSYDELGLATLKGRNPINKNEIALGVNVAKDLNKDIGDVVEVYLEGKKHSLMVSGIYQAIANMSYSARITADTVKTYNPEYMAMEICFINLNDSSQSDSIVAELNEKYKDSISAVTQ